MRSLKIWERIMEINGDRDFMIEQDDGTGATWIDVNVYRDPRHLHRFDDVCRDCTAVVVTNDDCIGFQMPYPQSHWTTDTLYIDKYASDVAMMIAREYGKPVVFQEVQ
jgi:hypothetical protein